MAALFLPEMFDWKFTAAAPAVMMGPKPSGIGGRITALGHDPHHYTIFCVEVEDVAASLKKAESLGGKALVRPIDIPAGTFAWMPDPDGNTVGLSKAR